MATPIPTFRLQVANKFPIAGTVFLRARHLNAAYSAADYTLDGTRDLVGDSCFDCSFRVPAAARRYPLQLGYGAEFTTLFFELAPGEAADVYLKVSDSFTDAAAWFSPFGTDAAVAASSAMKSAARFDFSGVAHDSSFHISAVEGVSAGIRLNVTSVAPLFSSVDIVARPSTDPRLLYAVPVDRTANYAVALPPAHSLAGGDPFKALAECDPAAVLGGMNACAMHRCRVYYAREAAGGASYVNWLRDTGSVALGWRYDDWECEDDSCGYRADGVGAPVQLAADGLGDQLFANSGPDYDGCAVPAPASFPVGTGSATVTLWDARSYSCGFSSGLPRPSAAWLTKLAAPLVIAVADVTDPAPGPGTWWKPVGAGEPPDAIGAQCRETRVAAKALIYRRRIDAAAVVAVDFLNIEWLTGLSSTVNEAAAVINVLATADFKNRVFVTPEGARDVTSLYGPASAGDLLTSKASLSQYVSIAIVVALAAVAIGLAIWFMRGGFARIPQSAVAHGVAGASGRAALGLSPFDAPRPGRMW
jgi:hypothetical protein